MKTAPVRSAWRWRQFPDGWRTRRDWPSAFSGRRLRSFAVLAIRVGRAWLARAFLYNGTNHAKAVLGYGRTRRDAVEALATAIRNGWPEAGTAWRPR